MFRYLISFTALFLFLFVHHSEATAQAGWVKSYEHAVVASADAYASEVGRDILNQGGNAVDAAVAVQFTLAVTYPRAGNIGGGGFMVIHLKDGKSTALDFRETAPEKASRNMFLKNGEYRPELSRRSILSSGVPGTVDGMVKALEHYGRLPLEAVMEPAIKLAREGFRLSWEKAQKLNEHASSFKKNESSKRYFTKASGSPYSEGDLFIQNDLANTLERIARFGREGFYSGVTADLIVDEMEKQGGIIRYRDLQNYDSKWRKPLTAEFHGYTLHMMPPPSSGSIVIAQILNMIDGYDLKELGFNSARYIHLLTETMRRSFADRAHFLGDPDFVTIPTTKLTGEGYAGERMRSFSWQRASESQSLGHGTIRTGAESSQTTHFSVVDEEGNAVSVTTTLNGWYGNHHTVSGAGFLLNNEMDDFTAQPGEPNRFGLIQGEANAIQPGKRMLSSMTPTIVTRNGTVKMVLGAAGGPRIINATLQNFLNLAVFGMNAQQSVSSPRFHHQWLPDLLYFEPFGITLDTQQKLRDLGHELKIREVIGRSHIIFVDEHGNRTGAADPRANGQVSGY